MTARIACPLPCDHDPASPRRSFCDSVLNEGEAQGFLLRNRVSADPESPPRRRRVRNRRPSSPSFSGGGASFGPALGRSLSGPVSPGEPDPAQFSSTPQQKQAMQRFLQQRKAEKEQKRQRAAEQGYPAHHDLRGDLAPLHVPPRRMQFGGSAQAGLDYQSGHFTQLLMQDGSPMDVHEEGAGGAMRDPGLTGGMVRPQWQRSSCLPRLCPSTSGERPTAFLL
jgi:hypothetical protein